MSGVTEGCAERRRRFVSAAPAGCAERRRRFVSAVPVGCAERRGGLSLPSPVMSSSPCCLNKRPLQ